MHLGRRKREIFFAFRHVSQETIPVRVHTVYELGAIIHFPQSDVLFILVVHCTLSSRRYVLMYSKCAAGDYIQKTLYCRTVGTIIGRHETSFCYMRTTQRRSESASAESDQRLCYILS